MMSPSAQPREDRADGPIGARAHAMGHAAAGASEHPVTGYLMRLGFVVRGIMYLLPGVLALRLAFETPGSGGGGRAITATGALEIIAHQPLGRFLLIPIAVGLAGYSLWGVVRAVLDPLNRGNSPKGIGARLGYVVSAVAFAGLFIGTYSVIAGTMSHMPAERHWTAELLAKPFGRWLVGIIGLCWIAGAGINQIVIGWRGSFEKDLRQQRMSRTERWWAVRLGRVGHVARGVVFTIIGMLIVAAAIYANGEQSLGMDGALLELLKQPFGRILLSAVALGLVVFGAYSVMCARWMRIPSKGSRRQELSRPASI